MACSTLKWLNWVYLPTKNISEGKMKLNKIVVDALLYSYHITFKNILDPGGSLRLNMYSDEEHI